MKLARLSMGTLFATLWLTPALAQEPNRDFVVIDLRPADEKNGLGLMPLEGKCNKDVFRIADVASDPLKVDVLKADLAQVMDPGRASQTLTVLNWSIYYNKQVQKGGTGLQNIGVQGYSIPAKAQGRQPGSKCSRRESAGGWYQADEITSVYFPIVSEFEGTFGGRHLNARVVYSPSRKLTGKFAGGADDTEALLQVIHQTSEAVIAEMNR
jgi:hypothetical protein